MCGGALLHPYRLSLQRMQPKAEGGRGYPKPREEHDRIERRDRKDSKEYRQRVSSCLDLSKFATSKKEG